jgi:hypothetical protein
MSVCPNPQIYYYSGPPGPPGPFGPPGPPGNLNDTALSFVYSQLAHVITQLIKYYPTTTLSVYVKGFAFTFAGYSGTPVELYSSPDGTYGGLFVIQESGYTGAVPLQAIASIIFTDGIPYNTAITYLPKPKFPQGFDKNIVTSIHDYLPIFTPVVVYTEGAATVSGVVYKNVYGMLVIADDTAGNNPIFIPVTSITGIIPSFTTSTSTSGPVPVKDISNSKLIISYEPKQKQ